MEALCRVLRIPLVPLGSLIRSSGIVCGTRPVANLWLDDPVQVKAFLEEGWQPKRTLVHSFCSMNAGGASDFKPRPPASETEREVIPTVEGFPLSSDVGEPGAELCPSAAKCVTPTQLGSADGLQRWLEERLGCSSSRLQSWGKALGTKPVSNLWCELLEGEISLEDSRPPKRTVHVASVHVRNEAGNYLVEASQEMADGRIRHRNRPLSEKMKPGESVEKACLRGIYEELGSVMGGPDKIVIHLDTYTRQEEERESLSYPGLMTRYVIHTMVALVKDLPSTQFCTVEDEPVSDAGKHEHGGLVKVKKHFWSWVSEAMLAV